MVLSAFRFSGLGRFLGNVPIKRRANVLDIARLIHTLVLEHRLFNTTVLTMVKSHQREMISPSRTRLGHVRYVSFPANLSDRGNADAG